MASVAKTIIDNAFESLSTKPRVQVITLLGEDGDYDDDEEDADDDGDDDNVDDYINDDVSDDVHDVDNNGDVPHLHHVRLLSPLALELDIFHLTCCL